MARAERAAAVAVAKYSKGGEQVWLRLCEDLPILEWQMPLSCASHNVCYRDLGSIVAGDINASRVPASHKANNTLLKMKNVRCPHLRRFDPWSWGDKDKDKGSDESGVLLLCANVSEVVVVDVRKPRGQCALLVVVHVPCGPLQPPQPPDASSSSSSARTGSSRGASASVAVVVVEPGAHGMPPPEGPHVPLYGILMGLCIALVVCVLVAVPAVWVWATGAHPFARCSGKSAL
eukprot:m51a1_g10204 hypothetical protein (233) ;mRNA; f:64545-65543